MNEIVLELAKQAGLKKEHGSDREYIGNFDWREFAELIVEECANVEHYWLSKEDKKAVALRIKEHFGVGG